MLKDELGLERHDETEIRRRPSGVGASPHESPRDVDQHHEFHGHLQDHPQLEGSYCSSPRTEIDVLATKIEQEAEFLARHSDTARAIVDGFKASFDREIRLATDNNIDLNIVLALGIIGVTVLEVGATAATPVWVTLSLFALNHVIEMHTHKVDGAPPVAPVIVKDASSAVG